MKIIQRLISWILTLSLIFSISAQAWADTLTLPSSIKEIEEEAFLNADSLDEVVVPEGALSIGSRAFASSGVKKISLPESLSYIADDAFWDTNPTVSAIKGSYAYRWAAAHDLIMTLAFKDLSAYDYTTERAVFSENREIGLYHESWIRNYELANYEALEKKYGGEPEWSVEFVGEDYGASLWAVIGEWAGDGARAVDVGIDNEPEFPCTLRYQVTCAWGGETVSADGTLVYREAALPTGLDAPDEFHGLKVGEAYAFRQNVTPVGYTFGDFVYRDLWTYMDCDNWDEWENGECIRYIRPHEAGVFPATLVKRYNNIQMRKDVVLYVADENGNVPAAVPKLEEDYWFDMAVSVDDDSKYSFSIDNRTLGISFQNMQLLRSLYGDDCYWTFETVEGRQTELTWTDQTEYFEFSVNKFNTMTEGDEALIEATLHWGEASATTRFHFTFFRFEMPDQIEFDQNISMTVNETYRATVRVAPENWKEKYFLYYDVIGTDAVEKWNDEDYSAYYLRAHQPGYYVARPHIHAADNVFIWGDTFSLLVYDADGNLPDPIPVLYLDGEVFEYGYMIGDSDAQDGEGWIIMPMAFSRMIENITALCAAYGNDPAIEWGYSYTGGMEVELELVPWQSDRFMGDACGVRINGMPTSTGYMEFNMTCDWNGHRGVQPCKLWFFNRPERLPNTNTIPADITVTVGETAYFYGDYPEGEYDIPSYYCWIEADDEYVSVIQNQAEPHIVGITGLQEGTITAYARVGVVENSYVQKPITIHVVERADVQVEARATDCYRVSWSELEDVEAYGISVYTDSDCQDLAYFVEGSNGSTDIRTDVGTQYWFVVEYRLNGEIHSSAATTAEPIYTLSAPENLTATVDEEGTVHLSWDAVAGASKYRIYYSNFPLWTVDTDWFLSNGTSGDNTLSLAEGEAAFIWVCPDTENGPNQRAYVEATHAFSAVTLRNLADAGNTLGSFYLDPDMIFLSTEGITNEDALAFINTYNEKNAGLLETVNRYNEEVDKFMELLSEAASELEKTQAEENSGTISINSGGVYFKLSGDRIDDLTDDYSLTEYSVEDGAVQLLFKNEINDSIYMTIADHEAVISGTQVASNLLAFNDTSAFEAPNSYSEIRYDPSALENAMNIFVNGGSDVTGILEQYLSVVEEGLSRNLAETLRYYSWWKPTVGELNQVELVQTAREAVGNVRNQLGRVRSWGNILGIASIADGILTHLTLEQTRDSLREIWDHNHPTSFERKYTEHKYHADRLNDETYEALGLCTDAQFWNGMSIVSNLGNYLTFLGGPVGRGIGIGFTVLGSTADIMSTRMSEALRNVIDTINRRDRILHYEIRGTVDNKDTGERLDGVTIRCEIADHDTISVTTDDNGDYYLEPLGDAVKLTFIKEGYFDLPVNLPEDGLLITTDVFYPFMAHMEATNGTIWGKVSDRSGKGIENVNVTCGEYSAVTDADGNYILRPLPGTYQLVYSREGYVKPKPINLTITEKQRTEVNVTLRPSNIILTRQDLESMESDGDYYLGNNIDLSDAPWTPLPWFSGTLDGRGHSIYGMAINQSFDGNLGLFGGLNGARVMDLTVSGTIDIPANQTFTNVGLISGNSLGATIDDCLTYGSINISEGSGTVFTGGILGLGKAELSDSYSSADITVKTRNSSNVGGLIGKLNEGTISGGIYHGALSLEQTGSNASAYFTAFGTAYADNSVFHDCSVSGAVEVKTNDAFAHACGLGLTVSGINQAEVNATTVNGSAMASGCELGSKVTNTGSVTALCRGSGTAYAVGITGSSGVACENTGAMSAQCNVGDCLAVGVSDCADSSNGGSIISVCGSGNAVGQGMTNCSNSHNTGSLTVTYLGTDGADGALSAHGLSSCSNSINDGDVTGVIENAYVTPTVAGSANGNGCVNNGRVECSSASGPAVAYGVKGRNAKNFGAVRAASTGNASETKEAYAVASGITSGSSTCLNKGIVTASASHGAARAYGYDNNCSSCVSDASVTASTTYYKVETIDGRERITRGAAYAMNSTSTAASYRGFTVTAQNGSSDLIYLFHPTCDKHAGMSDSLIDSDSLQEPIDNCYILLGGAYSTSETE